MAIKLGNGKWAVKENNLLAYNDNSGKFFNKEFDFARGSSATYVGKDGLIKTAGLQDTDLVQNGDFSTDSNWSKGTGWIIENGALRLTTTSTDNTSQAIGLVQNNFYEITFTVSNTTLGGVRIRLGLGALSGASYTNGTHTIQLQQTTTNDALRIYSDLYGVFNGTVDDVSVKEIQVNTPRIDFSDSANGALLLEPSRTNQATNNQQMHTYNALGGSNPSPSLTANYITAPDGTLTATRLQTSTTGSNYSLLSFPSTSQGNGSYTVSVYVKSNTGQNQTIAFYGQSSGSAAKTVTTEWTRIKFTGSRGSGLTKYAYLGTWNSNLGTDSNIDISIWGAQIEVDSTYATSYIPTQGAAATRLAETCNNSGSVQDFNSEEGVLYAEISALANDGTFRQITISDGSTSNRVYLTYSSTSNQFTASVISNGSLVFNSLYTSTDLTNNHKIAIKYKQNDFALWVDGVEVATGTSGNTPSGLSKLDFDFLGGNKFSGNVRDVRVYNTALSDSELASLTS